MANAALVPEARCKMDERDRAFALAFSLRVPSPWGFLFCVIRVFLEDSWYISERDPSKSVLLNLTLGYTFLNFRLSESKNFSYIRIL